tara:strand:+ start:2193 stop:3308 length:1116 start_codon:yes stop_codon:yes gene_type:complete
MSNDHQKFTGINLHGSDQHGTGTWKSLCGESNEDIINVFYEVIGSTPTDIELGNARWLLGASLWYGEAIKCPTLDDYATWLQKDCAPEVLPEPGNGLRHDWRKATASWLYPGDETYWIASHRLCSWLPDQIERYLRLPEIASTTHVLVCANTGHRSSTFEEPFNALSPMHPYKVRDVLEQIIADDKAPIVFCMSQEFFYQELQGNHSVLLDHLKATAEMVADLCHFLIPFRELGDVYGGNFLQERNDIFLAMRKGAPKLPLAEHERSLEQIPVQDFMGVGGTIISGLQTGFGTSSSAACAFLKSNADRMNGYAESGHILEDHVNAVFEHSLPKVYDGQSWKPTRTYNEAKRFGQELLRCGAAFDLCVGAKL